MIGSFTVATRTGIAALRANPVRTLLATLGVVIGSGSLVSILAVSDGVERYARTQVAREGFDRLAIRPITHDTVDGVRVARTAFSDLGTGDLDALAAALQPGERAWLTVTGIARATIGDSARVRAFALTGVAHVRADSGATLAAGRHLTLDEMRDGAAVVVVSNGVARALVTDKRPLTDALGRTVTLGGHPLEIVGVTADSVVERGRPSLLATVPFEVARAALASLAGPKPVPTLVVVASQAEDVASMRGRVESFLAARQPAWRASYEILARAESQLAQVSRGLLVFRLLMGSITGITLIVGGIGIMNVLLASVAERTREIGVRKAVGAKRRDILLQFLAESVTITGAGAVLGTALGLGAAYAVTAFMRAQSQAVIYAAATPQTMIVSALAAITVGIVFGSYPAARAARMMPIDAIRTE